MSDTDDMLEVELRDLLSRVLEVQLNELRGYGTNLKEAVSSLATTCKNMPLLYKNFNEFTKEDGIFTTQNEEQTEALSRSIAEGKKALAQQVEQLHGTLAQTHSTLEKQSQDIRQDLHAAREVLASQSKVQIDDLGERLFSRTEALTQQAGDLQRALAETHSALNAQGQKLGQELMEAREALSTQFKMQADVTVGVVTKQIDTLGLALNAVQQHTEEQSGTLGQATARLVQSFEEKTALTQGRLSTLERKIGLLTGLSIAVVVVLIIAVAGMGSTYLLAHPGFRQP
jgi:hypothetical protein